MKRNLILFFILLSLFSLTVSAIKFNELMYNAIGSDDDVEWIEIFNEKNTTISFQSWKLFEEGTNHNVVSVVGYGDYVLQPSEYAVIAENPAVFLANNKNFTGTLFDSTFSLSNSGETIVLKNKTGQVQDNLTYSYLWGGSENGFSIGFHRNIWKETIPTPGFENSVSDVCDWRVLIDLNKLIFEDKTDVSWQVRTERVLGEPDIIVTIKRSVEDMYGKIIKSYADLNHNLSNRETLSYEPNLNPGTYLLKAEIVPNCNDADPENNYAEELIAVKGTSQSSVTQEKDSSVEIKQLYDLGKDKKASFGQVIRVKVNAYRGDTAKQVISLWIEDGSEKVSKVFEFKLASKYMEQEFTVPIQIFPNCNNKLENGNYDVVLSGLGESDKMKLDIEDNAAGICPKETKTEEKKTETKQKESDEQESSKETDTQQAPSQKSSFNSGKPFALSTVMFESSQKKAEKLIPFGLISVLTTMVVVFILTPKIP